MEKKRGEIVTDKWMPCFPQNLYVYIWGCHADATIHIMLVKHTKADCITVGLLETLSGNKMFFLMDPPLFDYLTCKNLVQRSSFMPFPPSVRLDVISGRFRSDFQFGFWSGLWWDIDMVFGKLSNLLCDFWDFGSVWPKKAWNWEQMPWSKSPESNQTPL